MADKGGDVAAMQQQMLAMQKLLEQQSRQLEALKSGGDGSSRDAGARGERGGPSGGVNGRMGSSGGRQLRGRSERQEVAPSKVLHLRNTPKEVTKAEIEALFGSEFGPCVKIVPLPGKPQALVELRSIEIASRALQHLEQSRMAQIRNNKIYFNYSHRAEIEEPRDPASAAQPARQQQQPTHNDSHYGGRRGENYRTRQEHDWPRGRRPREDDSYDDEPRRRARAAPAKRREEDRRKPAGSRLPQRRPDEDFDNYDDYDDRDLEDMRPKNGDQLRTVAEWNAYVRSYKRRRRREGEDDDDHA